MKNKWGLNPDLLECFRDTIHKKYGNVSQSTFEYMMDKIIEENERMRFISAGLSESDWQDDPD